MLCCKRLYLRFQMVPTSSKYRDVIKLLHLNSVDMTEDLSIGWISAELWFDSRFMKPRSYEMPTHSTDILYFL